MQVLSIYYIPHQAGDLVQKSASVLVPWPVVDRVDSLPVTENVSQASLVR